jgi:protocatechuate 3,4-dioxygenase beta subunit
MPTSDPRLPGATVRLFRDDGTGTLVDTKTTDANGAYRFDGVGPGDYKIVETPPPTYFNLFPQPLPQVYPTSLIFGQNDTIFVTVLDVVDNGSFNFGDQHLATVDGLKWHDLDGNGRWDAGEPGLPGWTIQLLDQTGSVVQSVVTMQADPSLGIVTGQYWFTEVAPGTYQIRELAPQGWIQTFPAGNGLHTITITPDTQSIAASFGETAPPNFGNFQGATVSGRITAQVPTCTGVEDQGAQPNVTVFLDLNNNGQRDTGEPSTVTDAAGNFRFTTLGLGTYHVREVLQPGWQQLAQSNTDFTVTTSGQNFTGVMFRNQIPPTQPLQCGSISGRVTSQVPDCSGLIDQGGRPGVTVFFDTNNNGQLDQGERSAVTDASGNYRFDNVGAGTYHIRVVVPSGANAVGPTLIDVIESTPTFTVTGIDFRLQLPPSQPLTCGSISGRVTHQIVDCNGVQDRGPLSPVAVIVDLNNDGRWQPGEPITGTDANGSYKLTNLGAGTHHVRAVLALNWTAVGPAVVDVVETTPQFTVTDVNFRIQVGAAPTPAECNPVGPESGGNIIPVFPGGPSPVLPAALGSKQQLLGSTIGQNPTATLVAQGAFVAGLYHNVLNRDPDAAGMTIWVQQLEGGLSRDQVARAFWQSAEHRVIEVNYWYQIYLNRSADAAGRTAWVNAMLAGATELDVVRSILSSPEFVGAATNQGRALFVSKLYHDVLGRPVDATGQVGWVQALASGVSPAAVAQAFITSTESNRRVVDLYYTTYLGRPADAAGEQAWLAALASGRATLESVAEAILASNEYFNRLASLATAG